MSDSVATEPVGPDEIPQHGVLFYEADEFLVENVAKFIGPALRAGDRALIIATPNHRAAIEARLAADVRAARDEGRYRAQDAALTLSRFMVDGTPDADRFSAVLGESLGHARADAPLRVFGEMVALLASTDQPDAALALEALWKREQQIRGFELLCAYPMRDFHGVALATALFETLDAHDSVVPTEGYSARDGHAARLREIAALQQKAASLEVEVSERRTMAERLEAALEAERSARDIAEAALRVRDEFLSTASHELRTPIAVLSVQAQMCLRRWERTGELEPERVVKALRAISRQADKLGRLVERLMDVACLDRGTFELDCKPTDLDDLITQVVATTLSLADLRTIHVHGGGGVVSNLDPLRMEQVLQNLLDNAIKYTPPDSLIELKLSALDIGWLELSVRDHGPGIVEDQRDHIFERFARAHSDGHKTGLGLGLYLSRTIVELHGGNIVAEYPSDGGTRFVVRLPV